MISVNPLQKPDKIQDIFALLADAGTENTGNDLRTIKWRPGKFASVVVEETGRETDALVSGHVG